jgi:beta-galactosidase
VQAGGTLVVSQRTGVKDEFNAVINQRLPGLLAEICGVEVEEYDSLSAHLQNEVAFTIPELADPLCVPVGVLCDILKPTSATVVARYRQEYYAGKPAITLNQFGAGRVLYVGAVGEAQLYDVLAKWLLETTHVQNISATPPGVEVSLRAAPDRNLYFVLNHTANMQTIHLENHYVALPARQPIQGDLQLAPFDALILESSDLE